MTLVGVLLTTQLAAGFSGDLFYGDVPPEPVSILVPDLLTQVRAQARKHAIGKVWVERPAQLDGTSLTVNKLTPVELQALLFTFQNAKPGLEYDLLVADQDAFVPVTVLWNGPSTVRILRGSRVASVRPPPRSRKDAEAEYKVVFEDSDDRSWDDRSVGIVARALAHLNARERAVLTGLRFVRRPSVEVRPDDMDIEPGAAYVADADGARIELYDGAFDELGGFVGPVTAPQHPSIRVVLHEVAHALGWTDHRRKVNYLAGLAARLADEEDPGEIERITTEIDTLMPELREPGRSAASVAFAEWRFRMPGPTWYGTSSEEEAWAEAFALYEVDPDALIRVHPHLYDFFEQGQHRAVFSEPGHGRGKPSPAP